MIGPQMFVHCHLHINEATIYDIDIILISYIFMHILIVPVGAPGYLVRLAMPQRPWVLPLHCVQAQGMFVLAHSVGFGTLLAVSILLAV